MSYTNYINKLSSETKKALEESSNVNQEIQDLKKYKFSMKHLNDNSIGYTIKYKINIDEDFNNIINPVSYEILICYLIENILFIHLYQIVYHIYNFKKEIFISFFHINKDYLQLIHSKIIKNISESTKEISKNIRIKFANNLNLPFSLQIKILKKEYPTLLQTICNKIYFKKLEQKSKEIVTSIIKILQINEIEIIEYSSIQISTYYSNQDPVSYLDSLEDSENSDNYSKEDDDSEKEKELENNNIEFINKNIRELFWHSQEPKISTNNKSSNKFKHSLIFIFIFAIIVYLLPKFINKLSNFNKNNVVIDNILDLATEDLTQTNINKKPSSLNKLDTIIENQNEPYEPYEPYEPNEPNEPNEPSDQPDELKVIASNILRKYNESSNNNKNIELKNIKNRLKLILEETSTN
jgi:hypothetical protein